MTFVWSFTNSVTQVGDKYLRTKLYVLKLFPAQRRKVLSSSEVESTFQLRGGKYFPPQRRKVLSTSEAESDSIQTWKQIQYIKSRILDVDRRSFNVDRRNEALRNSLERGLAYKKDIFCFDWTRVCLVVTQPSNSSCNSWQQLWSGF